MAEDNAGQIKELSAFMIETRQVLKDHVRRIELLERESEELNKRIRKLEARHGMSG